jgi:hypothetical protein
MGPSRRSRIALAVMLASAVSSRVVSQDAQTTSAVAGGVEVEGVAQSSSQGEPREPRYVLRNPTAEPRTVVLLSLASLDAGRRHPLELTSPRTVVLAPGETREISIAYAGEPVQSGRGLPYHRYALTLRVGGVRARVIASTAYMCRIPLRDDRLE